MNNGTVEREQRAPQVFLDVDRNVDTYCGTCDVDYGPGDTSRWLYHGFRVRAGQCNHASCLTCAVRWRQARRFNPYTCPHCRAEVNPPRGRNHLYIQQDGVNPVGQERDDVPLFQLENIVNDDDSVQSGLSDRHGEDGWQLVQARQAVDPEWIPPRHNIAEYTGPTRAQLHRLRNPNIVPGMLVLQRRRVLGRPFYGPTPYVYRPRSLAVHRLRALERQLSFDFVIDFAARRRVIDNTPDDQPIIFNRDVTRTLGRLAPPARNIPFGLQHVENDENNNVEDTVEVTLCYKSPGWWLWILLKWIASLFCNFCRRITFRSQFPDGGETGYSNLNPLSLNDTHRVGAPLTFSVEEKSVLSALGYTHFRRVRVFRKLYNELIRTRSGNTIAKESTKVFIGSVVADATEEQRQHLGILRDTAAYALMSILVIQYQADLSNPTPANGFLSRLKF